MNDYSLQPFSINSCLSDLKLTANIVRHTNTLAICYTLIGNLAELMILAPADLPACKDELWEETCFEFFLALKQSPHYWEFNLSPAGHWNVYRFAAYRQGMQAEMAFQLLPFRVQTQPGCLSLALELDLTKIVPIDQALEVAISTVIKPRDGEVSYWALTHPGSQADFHHRDSFIVEL
ncbi:hypothetical protein AVDCRST_MAG81-4431 [uncultured Synechococcales cyanobacterium]|uniref:DOMON-like domain-containing protein n=1 Tax=uncultured Synechococcales cyanobacterium TaxID=1936017 RepID=A0A6J4VSW8_9CYAN|nr:hypothetical protein AVDCRST_MAG81-4431 [uncultured Synechococcales cyanobacterium]